MRKRLRYLNPKIYALLATPGPNSYMETFTKGDKCEVAKQTAHRGVVKPTPKPSLLGEDFSKIKVISRPCIFPPSHKDVLFDDDLFNFLYGRNQKLDIITYTISPRLPQSIRNLTSQCIVGLPESLEVISREFWPNTEFRITQGVHIKLYLLRNPRKSKQVHTEAVVGSHNFVINTSFNISYVISDRNHIAVLSQFFYSLWNSLGEPSTSC